MEVYKTESGRYIIAAYDERNAQYQASTTPMKSYEELKKAWQPIIAAEINRIKEKGFRENKSPFEIAQDTSFLREVYNNPGKWFNEIPENKQT